ARPSSTLFPYTTHFRSHVGAVGVCGSDIHQYHNSQSWPVRVPVVLGHEFCGTVAEVGARVRGFREGDRVVSETAANICGESLLRSEEHTSELQSHLNLV